ncbi:hypothetical protein A2U01_0111400, partial [Trifolium medium]|nr:hypothetical protein [Trifolium medium]
LILHVVTRSAPASENKLARATAGSVILIVKKQIPGWRNRSAMVSSGATRSVLSSILLS